MHKENKRDVKMPDRLKRGIDANQSSQPRLSGPKEIGKFLNSLKYYMVIARAYSSLMFLF